MSFEERRRSVRFAFDGPPIPAAIESPPRNFRVTGVLGDISRHGCRLIGRKLIGQPPRIGDDVLVEFSFESMVCTHSGTLRRHANSMGCPILGIEFGSPLPQNMIDAMFPDLIGRVICRDIKKKAYSIEGMLGEMIFRPVSWIARHYRSAASIDLQHVDRWDARGVFAIALAQQYGVHLINVPKGIPLNEV